MRSSDTIVKMCQDISNLQTWWKLNICSFVSQDNVIEAAFLSPCHHEYGKPRVPLTMITWIVISTSSAAREEEIQTIGRKSYWRLRHYESLEDSFIRSFISSKHSFLNLVVWCLTVSEMCLKCCYPWCNSSDLCHFASDWRRSLESLSKHSHSCSLSGKSFSVFGRNFWIN